MIAPFLKEKFGWVEPDSCWWRSGGRQSREHLFKECRTWKEEIRTLWKEVETFLGVTEATQQEAFTGEEGFLGDEGSGRPRELFCQEVVRGFSFFRDCIEVPGE